MTEVCGLCGARITTFKSWKVTKWQTTHHEYHKAYNNNDAQVDLDTNTSVKTGFQPNELSEPEDRSL